jgi:hypothetical protein
MYLEKSSIAHRVVTSPDKTKVGTATSRRYHMTSLLGHCRGAVHGVIQYTLRPDTESQPPTMPFTNTETKEGLTNPLAPGVIGGEPEGIIPSFISIREWNSDSYGILEHRRQRSQTRKGSSVHASLRVLYTSS